MDPMLQKLQRQLEIMEKQKAEQALLRHKLEKAINVESAVQDKVYTSHAKPRKETNINHGSDQKKLKQTSNKAVEQIISQRTEEFQRSQEETAATIQYLAQQRQEIMKARNRLQEKFDMFQSLPSSVGNEVIMKPSSRHAHTYRSYQSSESYVHKLINNIPNAVDRIWSLRENLHQDYLSKRKPYAGEWGIESYKPWQIPDFLMVRRLLEDFVDSFIIKHIPSDYAIFEREKKIKLLNKKERGWNETSKILAGSSAVKLVAEEILLEVTAKVTRDVASEDIHQDVMFKRMSANMFMNETEVISTGNLKGRDLSDPVYDMVTHLFSSLHRNRDNRKRGIWVHSQPIVHPALPPPLPLIREPLSDSQKLPRRKASQKPDKKLDQTSRTKVV